jgi:murein DD-endopeptidase MepM/ murein hydrolase activator NlpD
VRDAANQRDPSGLGPPSVHSTTSRRPGPPPRPPHPGTSPGPGTVVGMRIPLPSPIRVHGRPAPGVVVAVLMVALVSPARPAGALGAPVDPVPVGVWPLQPTPQAVRAFDPPDTTFGAGHRGVDLAGSVGGPVFSALAGRVSFAGPLAGRGVVVVDHGPTRTTYEPVAAAVTVGQPVLRGQRIGTLELAGSHCFPRACLHWGWRRGETYLDPLLLVGGGPIRLLPLWRDQPVGSTAPMAAARGRIGRRLPFPDARAAGRAPPKVPPRVPTQPATVRSLAIRPLLL